MGIDFELKMKQPEGKPAATVLELGGWLDVKSEQRLVDAVQQARDAGAAYVLLDLANVDTITSAGIRAIQRSYLILTPHGADPKPVRLKLCNASPQVYQVLSVTGVLLTVPVYESQDIAVDSFGK
jgi:anti-anti-sigma factor